NEVTAVDEAKRYYGLLTFAGNLSGMFAGYFAMNSSHHLFISWIPYGKDAWDQSILFLCCTIIGVGLLTMGIFRWLNVNVIGPEEAKIPPKEKIKMSMRENIAYLARSKYL